MTKNDKSFVSLWDLQGELPDDEIMWTYSLVRGAFEKEHPHNMVDASDAYLLTVYPFLRPAEQASPNVAEADRRMSGLMTTRWRNGRRGCMTDA